MRVLCTLHGVVEVRLGLLGASRGVRGLLFGALSVLAHALDLLLGSLASESKPGSRASVIDVSIRTLLHAGTRAWSIATGVRQAKAPQPLQVTRILS